MVEVYTPDGQGSGNFFFIGSNAAGQTGSSYLASAACSVPEPTTTGNLGFPDMHIVMNVTGTTSTADLEKCVTIGDTTNATGSALCTAISDLDDGLIRDAASNPAQWQLVPMDDRTVCKASSPVALIP